MTGFGSAHLEVGADCRAVRVFCTGRSDSGKTPLFPRCIRAKVISYDHTHP